MPVVFSDIPDCVLRARIIPFLPLDTLVSLLLTARYLAVPVHAARQWEAGLAELSLSNTFDVFVRETLADNEEADISEFLLSDPRLGAAAFAALPAIARFQALASFCRASVGHFHDLHNVWGEANWTFQSSFNDLAATPWDLHLNKLVALEKKGKPFAFSRYNVMANLIKLTLVQQELCSSSGPAYWYDRLGEPDCDPFTGSSYRDSLSAFFCDAFVDDGEGGGEADPALAGVEPGSNAHLELLTARANSVPLTAALFGPTLLRSFLVLEEARQALPSILLRLETQEQAQGQALLAGAAAE
jgi:hypothetical protein